MPHLPIPHAAEGRHAMAGRVFGSLTLRVHLTPLALALHLATAVLLLPGMSAAVQAQDQGAAIQYDIPAGSLADALTRFAQQSSVSIAMDASQLRGLNTAGVQGRYEIEAGFAVLLQGSGYTVARTAGGYVLQAAPSQPQRRGETTLLSSVTVLGDGSGESAKGPVYGYVANRSATATKTDTSLMETPMSIHVVSREQMERQGIRQVSQAVRYTPGVSADIRGDIGRFDQLAFRGTGAVTDTFQYLDGLRLPRGSSYLIPQIDPYNLERVEVLKGPASVLYGQAPLGGIVNLVSKRPTEETFHEVTLGVGSYHRLQAGFDSGGAVNEDGSLLYRLTVSGRKSDTSVQHTEEERVSIAPAITWKPNASTSFTLLSFYQRDPKGGYYGVLPSSGTILPNPNGAIPRDFFDGSPDFNLFDRTQTGVGYEFSHQLNDRWSVQQNMRYWRIELEQNQVGSSGLQADDRTLNRYALWSDERLTAVNVDTRLQGAVQTGEVDHKLVFGVEVQRDHWTQMYGYGAAPTIDVYDPDYSQSITKAAATSSPDRHQRLFGFYAQDQMKAGRWSLVLGSRVDHADINTDNALTGIYADQTFTKFTWRAGLIHNFDNGLAPYVSYATSFDPAVTTNYYGDPFEPTRGKQYEVGIKYQPHGFDGLFTLAAFDLTQNNVLTHDPASVMPNAYVQTGEVKSKGAEFEARFSPLTGLSLVGGMAWINPKITKSNTTDLGKRPVSVARFSASLWADYELQDGPLAGLGMGGGVRYVGSAYADAANTQKVPHYLVADAMLRYELGRLNPSWKGASVALNVSNLFDKIYYTCNMANFCNYGQGRTVLGTMTYRW